MTKMESDISLGKIPYIFRYEMKLAFAQIVIPYLGDNISWKWTWGEKNTTTNYQIQLLIRNLIVMQPSKWNNILFCVSLGSTRCQVFGFHTQLSDVSQPVPHKAPSSLISYQYRNMYGYIYTGWDQNDSARAGGMTSSLLLHHRLHMKQQVLTFSLASQRRWFSDLRARTLHQTLFPMDGQINEGHSLWLLRPCLFLNRVEFGKAVVVWFVQWRLSAFNLIVFMLSRHSLPFGTFPTVNHHGKK